MINNEKLSVKIVIHLQDVQVGMENYSILTFSILDYLILDFILKILIQKNLPSVACKNWNATHISEDF